ncbi:Aste57867_14278 [Aphanomyces stellatus]|uniref:Aste57867_14278 protein n=1 Tax=Aphanomyces stellatus TaxID=120398 RepID=A0A485L135_9STRA|nr:hypothetical protein As57867_014226 [Aphanomyces stellatus]VFT91103.1 Aste57867_14278 [Aphanomyces stellatus]
MAESDARAARRARILASQEKRLKYVTGQADSLKKSAEEEHEDKTLDDMVAELAPSDADKAEGLVMPTTRVDPAQRRRDAALRKQQQQAKMEERLNAAPESAAPVASAPTPTPTPATTDVYASMASAAAPASTQASPELLKLAKARQDHLFYKIEQWGVALVLLVAAVVLGGLMNIEGLVPDPRLKDVEEMLARGFSLDSIKQQMERDNVDMTFLVKQAFDGDASFPNTIPFLPSFIFNMFAPAVVNPPLLAVPVLVRMFLSTIFFVVRAVLQVPATADHESDDMGWIVKMLLAQVPMLRDALRMIKKTGDDFCLFLVVLCVTGAVRVVVLA